MAVSKPSSAPGHAHAGLALHIARKFAVRGQMSVDGRHFRVEIESAAHVGHQRPQMRREIFGKRQRQALRTHADLDPTDGFADLQHARIALRVAVLHAGQRAQAEEIEDRRDRIIAARREAHRECFAARDLLAAAHLRRRRAVAVLHRGVEAPQAAKAGGERDLGDGQRGLIEQTPRRQQTSRLCNIDGAGAELRVHHAAQMARGDAEFARERFKALLFERACFDARVGSSGETSWRIDRREAWRTFRAAKQARTETCGFSSGRTRPEGAVFALGVPRGANAAAINARRFDTDIEPAVEAAVLRVTGSVANVGVQHEPNMGSSGAPVSPDSDIPTRAAKVAGVRL